MRKTVAKVINDLVSDEEVITVSTGSSDQYTKRLKKSFWNTLNWREKTKRMKVVNAKKFLETLVK